MYICINNGQLFATSVRQKTKALLRLTFFGIFYCFYILQIFFSFVRIFKWFLSIRFIIKGRGSFVLSSPKSFGPPGRMWLFKWREYKAQVGFWDKNHLFRKHWLTGPGVSQKPGFILVFTFSRGESAHKSAYTFMYISQHPSTVSFPLLQSNHCKELGTSSPSLVKNIVFILKSVWL